MIDIDKFITSLLKSKRKPLTYINDEKVVLVSYDAIVQALKEQGLEFRDGSIVSTLEEKEFKPKFKVGDVIKGKITGQVLTINEVSKYGYVTDQGFITSTYEDKWELVMPAVKCNDCELKGDPDNLHQYLYGSAEDEKIRKVLIGWINIEPIENFEGGFTKEQILTWLEKQCEKYNVWHNSNEEPERNRPILLIMKSGNAIVATIIEPNHSFVDGERWAYIDELIEKQGEQKPVEWSEEDERKRNRLIHIVEDMLETFDNTGLNDDLDEQLIPWLKSLSPQKQWKPTEEQLLAVEVAINVIGKGTLNGGHLIELLEQLKAL